MAGKKAGLTPKKRDLFERAAHLQFNRFSIPQIALELGVPERTIRRHLTSSDYLDFFRAYQEEFKEQAEALLSSLGDQVIRGMAEMAFGPKTRSDMARFQAIKALGDWIGLGQQREPLDKNSKEDLAELHALLETRKERSSPTTTTWVPSQTSVAELPIEPLEYRPEVIDVEARALPDFQTNP